MIFAEITWAFSSIAWASSKISSTNAVLRVLSMVITSFTIRSVIFTISSIWSSSIISLYSLTPSLFWAMITAWSPILSRSLFILRADMISLRSVATGWVRAKIRWHNLSIFVSSLSTFLSFSMICWASSTSPLRRASNALWTCSATRFPIFITRLFSLSSSSSKWRSIRSLLN